MTTRDRILDAAADVIRALGLGRATTKEIARAAGFSEATLYKHFSDKEDLFQSVLRERLPGLVAMMKRLPEWVGRDTVEGNLQRVARMALTFYEDAMPMAASVYSQPALLGRIRGSGWGPHRGIEALAAYLRAEQALGRVPDGIVPETAAALLLGACMQDAFLRGFTGEEATGPGHDQLAAELVQALMRGLRMS